MGDTSPPVGYTQWDEFERLAKIETDECIVWPYGLNAKGYGRVRGKGRTVRTHVEICERHYGPRPDGMYAAHAAVICHNRACMNYRHLRWATPTENYADMVKDGTLRTGPGRRRAPRRDSKLTAAAAAEIRRRYELGGTTYPALGREYGVSQSMIYKIVRRGAWSAS